MSTLFDIWNTIQSSLFPRFEGELDPLSEKEKQFIRVVSLLDLGKHLKAYAWRGIGRRRKSRLSLAKAFIAKSVYNLETTDILIEYLKSCKNLRRLCGWESRYSVPSKSTFSRAFSAFSQNQLAQNIHEAMIKTHYGSKLSGHVSRDATAIKVREKPVKKTKSALPPMPKRKRGRPRKGEQVSAKPMKRLDLQPDRSLKENLKDLPTQCDVGTKINSKGHKTSWIGYKLHIDCVDGDIPVSAVLTSASMHDSQAAIPLAQMTAERVTSLYDLMDSAYDAPQIKDFSHKLGHVPIIDHNPRRSGEKIQMDPATQARFGQRSSAERINSTLKDNYGGSNIRVKGSAKVMTHLMFGVIVTTAMQLYRLLL
jgi:hypothetical protein